LARSPAPGHVQCGKWTHAPLPYPRDGPCGVRTPGAALKRQEVVFQRKIARPATSPRDSGPSRLAASLTPVGCVLLVATVRATPGEVEKLRVRRDAEALLALLAERNSDASPKVRRRVALALYRLRDPTSARPLMRVAGSDPDSEVRLLALATLADLGDRATIPMMLSALQSHDMARRLHAIRGLANTRAPEIVQPLVATLDDAHGAIRAAAARALADIGDRAALTSIRAAHGGPSCAYACATPSSVLSSRPRNNGRSSTPPPATTPTQSTTTPTAKPPYTPSCQRVGDPGDSPQLRRRRWPSTPPAHNLSVTTQGSPRLCIARHGALWPAVPVGRSGATVDGCWLLGGRADQAVLVRCFAS